MLLQLDLVDGGECLLELAKFLGGLANQDLIRFVFVGFGKKEKNVLVSGVGSE